MRLSNWPEPPRFRAAAAAACREADRDAPDRPRAALSAPAPTSARPANRRSFRSTGQWQENVLTKAFADRSTLLPSARWNGESSSLSRKSVGDNRFVRLYHRTARISAE